MSHVKLFIRPPPHQEFLQGYSSIPSAQARPQAQLSGTIEVRPNPNSGIYASYLHLEFQKLEVIPKLSSSNPVPHLHLGGSPSASPTSSNGLLKFVETINLNPTVLWNAPPNHNVDTSDRGSPPKPEDSHSGSAIPPPSPISPTWRKSKKTLKRKPHQAYSAPFSVVSDSATPRVPMRADSLAGVHHSDRATPLNWAPLAAGDFEFQIPLPESLPPSVTIDSKTGLGIRYQLLATLCARPVRSSHYSPASWFKRSQAPLIVSTSMPIHIVRHQLHSAWPIYRQPNLPHLTFYKVHDRGISMKLSRQTVALGPGDEIMFRIQLESETLTPVKITRFEIILSESITYHSNSMPSSDQNPPQSDSAASATPFSLASLAQPLPLPTSEQSCTSYSTSKSKASPHRTRSFPIVDILAKVDHSLYHKNCLSFDVKGVLPSSHDRLTVQTASHLSIEYSFTVKALLARTSRPLSKKDKNLLPDELVINRMPLVIGDRDFGQAQEMVMQIGHVPSLSGPSPSPVGMANPVENSRARKLSHTASVLSRTKSFPAPSAASLKPMPSLTGIGAHHLSYSDPPSKPHSNALSITYPTHGTPPRSNISKQPALLSIPGNPFPATPYATSVLQSTASPARTSRYKSQVYRSPANSKTRNSWAHHTAASMDINCTVQRERFCFVSAAQVQAPLLSNIINAQNLAPPHGGSKHFRAPNAPQPVQSQEFPHSNGVPPPQSGPPPKFTRTASSSPPPPPFPGTRHPIPFTLPTSVDRCALKAPPPLSVNERTFISAEQEKERLFLVAKAEAERNQNLLLSHASSQPTLTSRSVSQQVDHARPLTRKPAKSSPLLRGRPQEAGLGYLSEAEEEAGSKSETRHRTASSPFSSPDSTAEKAGCNMSGEQVPKLGERDEARYLADDVAGLNILPQYGSIPVSLISVAHAEVNPIESSKTCPKESSHLVGVFSSDKGHGIAQDEPPPAHSRLSKLTAADRVGGEAHVMSVRSTTTSLGNCSQFSAVTSSTASGEDTTENKGKGATCGMVKEAGGDLARGPPPLVNLSTRPKTVLLHPAGQVPSSPIYSWTTELDPPPRVLMEAGFVERQKLAYLNALAQKEAHPGTRQLCRSADQEKKVDPISHSPLESRAQ